ncbi:hypothetical protein GCM10010277_36160 [Streptomyces longisporoflavus]|nr:hypothetical protein GCM10010277_36160 [Streptomyces longisporoflavus]
MPDGEGERHTVRVLGGADELPQGALQASLHQQSIVVHGGSSECSGGPGVARRDPVGIKRKRSTGFTSPPGPGAPASIVEQWT